MTLLILTLAAYAIWRGDQTVAIIVAGLCVWRGLRGPGEWWRRARQVSADRRARREDIRG